MGKKSDKKVKSEHVNALRKQYDAFLEEDKKRKERNEYILGRLDNMRYNTAAVQIRHKAVVYGDLLPVYNRVAYRPDQSERYDKQVPNPSQNIIRTNHQNLQLEVPRPYLDDTTLLKEISKKYILIPKLRPSLTNDYVEIFPPQSIPSVAMSQLQTNNNSSEDWKSKYDILEQLKKNDDEERINECGKDELFPVKESPLLVNDNLPKVTAECNLPGYNTEHYRTKYEQEIPEKDLTSGKFKNIVESKNLDESKTYNNKDEISSADQTSITGASAYLPENDTASDYTLFNKGLENPTAVNEKVMNTSNIQVPTHHFNNPEQNGVPEYNTGEPIYTIDNSEHQLNENPPHEPVEYPVEYEEVPVSSKSKFPDTENVYLDQDNYNPLNQAKLDENIQRGNLTSIERKEDDAVDYPAEMINVEEFTPNSDVQLVDGVNINPVYLASEKEVEPLYQNNPESEPNAQQLEEPSIQPTDNSGIEEFNAEQKEMFYSEETDAYAYEQQQQATGNVYDQKYAPTEEYQQPEAQDYTYYEGTTGLQEQDYPVEVNEHEETTSRYDQNYEQQYAPGYEQQGYDAEQEQQQGYDAEQEQQQAYDAGQEQQQYQQPADGYDQTQQQYQDYEYQQGEHGSVQNVEQVLDNEQGYVEEQNVEASQRDHAVDQQVTEEEAS